jgi:polyisoprenoid-binding protein YceI
LFANLEVLMRTLLAILLASPLSAQAERYVGDDATGSISFGMNATLHEVGGTASSFTTELNLDEAITGLMVVQGTGLKTGIGVRDKRMYTYCLETDKYPTIEFTIRGAKGDTTGLISKSGSGTIELHGKLKVRSTSRDVVIPTQYNWTETGLQLKGTKQIKWTDFGVPDPSIVISTLYPEVAVDFDLNLREGL